MFSTEQHTLLYILLFGEAELSVGVCKRAFLPHSTVGPGFDNLENNLCWNF
jgi:hypothetical protein